MFVCEVRSTADRAYQECFVYYIDYKSSCKLKDGLQSVRADNKDT